MSQLMSNVGVRITASATPGLLNVIYSSTQARANSNRHPEDIRPKVPNKWPSQEDLMSIYNLCHVQEEELICTGLKYRPGGW